MPEPGKLLETSATNAERFVLSILLLCLAVLGTGLYLSPTVLLLDIEQVELPVFGVKVRASSYLPVASLLLAFVHWHAQARLTDLVREARQEDAKTGLKHLDPWHFAAILDVERLWATRPAKVYQLVSSHVLLFGTVPLTLLFLLWQALGASRVSIAVAGLCFLFSVAVAVRTFLIANDTPSPCRTRTLVVLALALMLVGAAVWLGGPGATRIAAPSTDLTGVDFASVDLTEASLEGSVLRGVNLRKQDLRRASLDNVDARNADLYKAELEAATLDGARLDEAFFGCARLGKASLRGASATCAEFSSAVMADTRARQADLSRSWFLGTDGERIALEGAKLTGALIDGSRFDGSRLEGASLAHARLFHSTFANASANGVDITHATLDCVSLDGAKLQRAMMSFSTWTRAAAKGADLQEVDLTEASLSDVRLEDSDLLRATAAGAKVERACLHADMRFSDWRGAEWTDVEVPRERAELLGADFRGAKFRRVVSGNLDGANLEGADFTRATLVDVSFRRANLANASFDGARLKNVDFSTAIGLQPEQLHESCGDGIAPSDLFVLGPCRNEVDGAKPCTAPIPCDIPKFESNQCPSTLSQVARESVCSGVSQP